MLGLLSARLKAFPITHVLVLLNCFIYIVLCAQNKRHFVENLWNGPGYDVLIAAGAKENGLIALGQVYRLVAPMFMHVNAIHLIVNMIGLWSVGLLYEMLAGASSLLSLYLISGITGNLCSFALLPYLSVGASGSLFGILLCLYVIQKYQEKILKKKNGKEPSFQLGNVILINGVLNLVFGFTIPIFDWACHLGGAIAGLLFGFALVTKHNYKLKIFERLSSQAKSFSAFQMPKRSFFEHHSLYLIGLIFVNLCFALSYFRVEKYQKIAGLGAYHAALDKTPVLTKEDFLQYKEFLIEKNKETNPDNLLYGAFVLSQNKKAFASYLVFSLLDQLQQDSFTSPQLSQEVYSSLLNQGLTASEGNKPLPSNFLPRSFISSQYFVNEEEICAKPANLFFTLGFFQLASLFYECAYVLNPYNDSYAVKAFVGFHKMQNEKGVEQVLTLVKASNNNSGTKY